MRCVLDTSSIKSAVIKYPEKVKKTSTPMKPPGRILGKK